MHRWRDITNSQSQHTLNTLTCKRLPHWLEGHYLLHAVCVCSIMKLFALLPLLVLTLLQGTLATHLETCQCDQVRQLVNSTVLEAVTGLEDRLSLLIHSAVNNINTTDNSALENLENRLTGTMERLLTPIQQQLDYHLPIEPNSQDHPAASCQDAFEKYDIEMSVISFMSCVSLLLIFFCCSCLIYYWHG